MASTKEHPILRFIRRITVPADAADGSDGQLLARFVAGRDETAFAALVRRHGPMVFGVCNRVLGASADAEDAFQATFLVLARRAAAVRDPATLGNWLYGVAYRTALKVRSDAAVRRARESRVRTVDVADPSDEVTRRDLRQVLDDELSRLPDKYRVAVVLCYLEGQTQEDAALLLGCPRKTVTTRLARACERLRGRLTRRGLALSGSALGVLLPGVAATAAPAALMTVTVNAAVLFAADETAVAGAVSARVLSLAKGVLKTMFVAKLKTAAVVLLAVVGSVVAASGFAYQALAADKPGADGGAAVKPDEKSKEAEALKELEGDWKVVELSADGRIATAEDVKGMSWKFKGMQLLATDPDDNVAKKADVKLDPTKDPRHFDFTALEGTQKGKTAQGIYKLEKGRLTVCLRDEKGAKKGRPTEFSAENGSDQGLIVLERVKPGAAVKPDDKSKEAEALKELEGDWNVVELAADGRKFTAEDVKGMNWKFNGTQLQTTRPGDKAAHKADIKLDPAKDPRHLDVTALDGDEKGKMALGIYKLEKGRLTACIRDESGAKKGRPTEFSAEKGSDQALIVLEQVK